MTQDEIQAVARALAGPRGDDMTCAGYPVWRFYRLDAQAAIAALGAPRSDRVAQVVVWLRACSLSSAIPDDPAQIVADLADAIEQSFANKT